MLEPALRNPFGSFGPGEALALLPVSATGQWCEAFIHWVGLRENLQETMFFPSNIGLSCKFSHHPIL